MVVCVADTKINGARAREKRAQCIVVRGRLPRNKRENSTWGLDRLIATGRKRILWKYYDSNVQHVMHNQQAGLTHDIRHRQIEHRIT